MTVHINPSYSTDVSRIEVEVEKEDIRLTLYDCVGDEITTISIVAEKFCRHLDIVKSLGYRVDVDVSMNHSHSSDSYSSDGTLSIEPLSYDDKELVFRVGFDSFQLEIEKFSSLIEILLKK